MIFNLQKRNFFVVLAVSCLLSLQVQAAGQQLNLNDANSLKQDRLEALIAQQTQNLGDPEATVTLTKKEKQEAKQRQTNEMKARQAKLENELQLQKEKEYIQKLNEPKDSITESQSDQVQNDKSTPSQTSEQTISQEILIAENEPDEPELSVKQETVEDLKQTQVLLISILIILISLFGLIIICMCFVINNMQRKSQEIHQQFKDEEQCQDISTTGNLSSIQYQQKARSALKTPQNLSRQKELGFDFSSQEIYGLKQAASKMNQSQKDFSELGPQSSVNSRRISLHSILSGQASSTNAPGGKMQRTKSHQPILTYKNFDKKQSYVKEKNYSNVLEIKETISDANDKVQA